MGLHTTDGARKYLAMAERADDDVHTLCMTLAYNGCRLSKVLALTADRVDLGAGTAVLARSQQLCHEPPFQLARSK